MIARSFRCSTSLRRAFTLVEMLITVTIISMMAGMVLFAMYGAQEAAKRQKTEALIARIDAVLKSKWESYRSRRVPVVIPADEPYDDSNGNGRFDAGVDSFTDLQWDPPNPVNTFRDAFPAARIKLDALHDLMRLEMPDRWSDVTDNPASFSYTINSNGDTKSFSIGRPSVSQGYLRKYTAANVGGMGGPTQATAEEYQGAECLYMIIQASSAEEGDDVSTILKPENVRDTDGDSFPEIVDAWGMPIRFLRWAPGFPSARSIMYTAVYDGAPPGTGMDAHRVEFWITGNGVPQDGKGIIGGTIIGIQQDSYKIRTGWDYANAAQISAYFFEPDNMTMPPTPRGRVVCTTPNSVGVPGSVAGANLPVVITGPDPFDPTGVYRKDKFLGTFPAFNQAGPPFALYPLVYSAGPDKSYGVISDSATPLRYIQQNVNPFFKPMGSDAMGTTTQIAGERGDWKDNIHNHALGQR